jgi:hypothetical protein
MLSAYLMNIHNDDFPYCFSEELSLAQEMGLHYYVIVFRKNSPERCIRESEGSVELQELEPLFALRLVTMDPVRAPKSCVDPPF